MARRWWKLLLVVVIAVPLLAWGYDLLLSIDWVGYTDLEVVFEVSDAGSGDPVDGARVEILQYQGGFYEEKDEKAFELITGAGGVAAKECRGSMCYGIRSGLRFTDTFGVHLPWWRFRVTASGYEPGEWVELDVSEYGRQVRRIGPHRDCLMVPVSLQKDRGAGEKVRDRQ